MFYQLKSINSCLVGETFNEPSESDFPELSYKYAELNWLLRQSLPDYVRSILTSMTRRLYRKHARILVDIKTHTLNAGQAPALQFWHIDAVSNPLHKAKEEINHIFVSGDSCLTEFLRHPIIIDIPETGKIDFDALFASPQYKHLVFPIKVIPNTIMTYGRHLHRATQAIKSCKRLLIRMTETDTILSSNKPFQVTYS